MTQSGREYFDIDDILASEERVAVIFNHDIPNIGKYIKTNNYKTIVLNNNNNEGNGDNSNNNQQQVEEEEEMVAGSDSEDDDEEGEQQFKLNFDKKYIIEKGSKIEIPFWLASICGKQGFVEIEIPKTFMDLNCVTSNYEKAQLSQVNKYFYDFGSILFKEMADIAANKNDTQLEDIYIQKRETIIETLKHRFKYFLDQAYVASHSKSGSSWLTEQYTEFKSQLCNSELLILQMIQSSETSFIDWKHNCLRTFIKQNDNEKNFITVQYESEEEDDLQKRRRTKA
ncbi:hypothetical protein ABK040_011826 [Willaertia magna]